MAVNKSPVKHYLFKQNTQVNHVNMYAKLVEEASKHGITELWISIKPLMELADKTKGTDFYLFWCTRIVEEFGFMIYNHIVDYSDKKSVNKADQVIQQLEKKYR